MKKAVIIVLLIFLVAFYTIPITYSQTNDEPVRLVLHFKEPITNEKLTKLERAGFHALYVFEELNAVTGFANEKKINKISSLNFIESIEYDTLRYALGEILPSTDEATGDVLTWDLDMINVPTVHEEYGFTGKGVYVAVLDTGLVPNWRDYFEEDKIATEFGRAYLAAAALTAHYNPAAWEYDTNSHGTHVTSTIIGYWIYDFYRVAGVAPDAKIIPVKVLGNAGWGWTTDVVAGILYIAELYKEEIETGGNILEPYGVINPIVISMSLGGKTPSDLERMAIDYAIDVGVIVVAAAGNEGKDGMTYPGGFPEVISVGAAGWTGEWSMLGWWREADVPEREEGLVGQVYVTNFSSRERKGQELDVLAPGSWIVGPYLAYGAAHPPYWSRGIPGQYYYVGGTSMATPHVSGIVALLLQYDLMIDGRIDLDQYMIEQILEESALYIPPGSAWVYSYYPERGGTLIEHTWGDDATGAGLVQADLAVILVMKGLPAVEK